MNKPVPPVPDFRTLFESAPGLYLVLLPDFTIAAVSNAYLQATMTKRDEILGRGIFEVFPDNPNDPAATGVSNLRASLQRVLQGKTSDTMAVQKYDIRRPASEGGGFEERYWSPVNYPVSGRDREIAYIIHRVEDVTEFIRLKQRGIEQHKATEELKTRTEQMEAEIFLRAQALQKANKQLLDNEIFLNSIVENLPNMVFVKQAKDLRFMLLNRAGEQLLGYPRADLIGKNDYDLFPKEQADFFVNHDRKVLSGGELLDIPEEPVQTRTRGTRLLHTKKIPILDSGGRPAYLLGISEDITDRRAAEERFRGLLESAPDAVVISGADGRIQIVNAQAEIMFGYARAELIGEPIERLVPERFRPHHVDQRHDYVRRPRLRPMSSGLDLYGRRKDGSEFPVAISLSPVGQGKDLLVFADIRDVTESRAIEARFRALAETANDAIVSADARGNIIYFNPAAERIFGYSVAEVMGRSLTALMPERFRAAHRDGLQRFLAGGAAHVVGKTVELVGRRQDGTEFPLELSLASWKVGDETAFTGVLRDITRRQQAEEEIRALNASLGSRNVELEAVNHELEAFSYSVSHDLRAPLRSIDGFSREVLETYAPRLDAQGQDYLRRVRAASQRMGHLIDDLLKLSRVTRAELQRGEIALSALAEGILAEHRQRQPERRIEAIIEPDLRVNADPDLMRVALDNLLGNAWKFTSRRDHARIEFGSQRQNDETVFFVRDDGAGFDPAYSAKLFGAFQRLHATNEFEGTGIGLATVQRIIRRHGGRIWAQAQVGRGATFFFTLPS